MNPMEKNPLYSYHVRKAIHYVLENFSEDINLSSVSHYLGLNKCYFCTMFKTETGENFSNYLNSIRIEQCKALLLNSSDTMVDIAFAVGYSSQSYFNNVFKKVTGLTPRQFRSLHLQLETA